MEILQNSILKLIVRQGSDSDRKSIILDSGELGYTVDTYRLFVGDGFLSGGNVVGNLFKGSAATITTASLWPALYGDSAFAIDTNKYYVLQTGFGNLSTDWLEVGGVYTPGNNQIFISTDNKISLNPLSANYISSDAVTSPIIISSGRVALSPLSANHVSSDLVTSPLKIDTGRIALGALSANSISVEALSSPLTISNGKVALLPLSAGHFSDNAVESPIYLSNGKIALGTLEMSNLPTTTTIIGKGLNVVVNGVNYNEIPYNSLSSNIVIETRQIHATYYGLSGQTLIYNRDLLTVERLSAGDYKFIFVSNITTNYIPMVQILGIDKLDYQPRVISTTLSSCHVKILNNAGATDDANVYLLINY